MHFLRTLAPAVFFSTLVTSLSTSGTLPVVDLGYELHRASSFDQELGYYNFSNIRYAAPPVGDLRFRAPRPPSASRSIIQDGKIGRVCPQAIPAWQIEAAAWALPYIQNGTVPSNYSYSLTTPSNATISMVRDRRETEDCLFLDVMVPRRVFESANKSMGAPVLIYIYGGGYTEGEKGTVDPTGILARSQKYSADGIIYVAMNYRTGAFGFLSGPTFQEDGTANAGLYDQRMALEWVQTNIHLFGGDKNRVTVFGGSAGAGSLIHQIVAFGGSQRAPFQQAIPQSPGWPNSPTLFAQERTFNDFLWQANASSLAELRQMPSNDLIYANAVHIGRAPYSSFIYGPVIDGEFVTQDPRVLLSHGQYFKDLRVMVAHNTNEGLGFAPPSINNSDFNNLIEIGFPTSDTTILDLLINKFYPPPSNNSSIYHDHISRAAFFATESNFACKAFSLASTFNESYGYWFDVFPATHGLDSSYVFYNPYERSSSSPNETLVFVIQDYVTTFAIHGTPSSSVDGLAEFPNYGKNGNVIKLGATSISSTTDSVANDRCRWWNHGLYM